MTRARVGSGAGPSAQAQPAAQAAQEVAMEVEVHYKLGENESVWIKGVYNGPGQPTAGDVLSWARNSLQDQAGRPIPASVNLDVLNEKHRPLKEDQALQVGSLVLLVDQRYRGMRVVEGPQSDEHAVPSPASLRQEASNFALEDNLFEPMDNSFGAFFGIKNPTMTVNIEPDAKGNGLKLIIEDTGHGMSEDVLRKVVRVGYTYSSLPNLIRKDKEPLPLREFLNRHFNRYGRGLVSLFYFGDVIEIRTKTANTAQGHCLRLDFKAWEQEYQQGLFYRCHVLPFTDTLNPTSQSYTRITISNLLEDVKWKLQDKAVKLELRKKVASCYHFLLDGFDKSLWERLPWVVKQSNARPTAVATLNFFDMPMGKNVDEENDSAQQPELVQLLVKAKKLYRQYPDLKPFVMLYRWVPNDAGKLPPGGVAPREDAVALDGAEDMEAGTDEYWEELAGDVTELLGQTQRKRAAGSASAAATPGPSTGPPAGRGRGRGRGASAAATPQNQKRPAPGAASTSKKRPQSAPQPKRKKKDPAEIEWLDSESSAESTEEETSEEEELRDMEDDRRGELTARNPLEQQQGRYVDFILVLMYYPHNRKGERTKPDGLIGALPIWSGRLMPEDPGCTQLPSLVEAAKKIGQKQQIPGYSRLDGDRIAGLIFASPDCTVAHHKTQLHDPAYKALRELGMGLVSKTAAGSAGQALDPLSMGKLMVFNYAKGEFQDEPDGAFSVRMLLEHHSRNWYPMEDHGQLVIEVEDQGARDASGLHWTSKEYKPPASSGYDSIKAGELVRLMGKEESGLGAANPQMEGMGRGRGRLSPLSHYRVVEFSELRNEPGLVKVRLKQWRPSWAAQPEEEVSIQVSVIRPVEKKAELRQATQNWLVSGGKPPPGASKKEKEFAGWENMAPYRLLFKRSSGRDDEGTEDPRQAEFLSQHPDGEYAAASVLDKVQVVFVSRRNKLITQDVCKDFGYATNAVPVEAALTKIRPSPKDPKVIWASKPSEPFSCDSGSVNTVTVYGFKKDLQSAGVGTYCLTITPRDPLGYMLPPDTASISYTFKVVAAKGPLVLAASWVLPAAAAKRAQTASSTKLAQPVRLGVAMPAIRVHATRGGQPAELPDLDTLRAQLTLIMEQQHSPTVGGAEDDDGDQAPQAGAFITVSLRPKTLGQSARLEWEGGSRSTVIISCVDPSPKVLAGKAGKVSHMDVNLKVRMEEGSSAAGQVAPPVESPPISLRVISGPPVSIGPSHLPDKAYSRGSTWTEDLELVLEDKHGNPWYNSGAGARASREAGQGEAGTSGNGEAAQEGPRSSKRERQQKVEGPRVAVLLLRGFRDNTRADRTVCELPVNDDGFISIPANRFFVTAMQGETAELVAVVQPDSFPPDQQPSSSKRGEMLRELGEGISLRAFKSEEFPEASSKHRELCKQLEGSLCVHIRVSVILGSITFEHPLLPRDMMETPPPPLQLASRRRGAISGPAASEVSGHASGPSSSAALAHSAVYDGDDVAQVFLMDLLLRNKDLAAAKKSAVAKAQPQEERWSKKDQWDILWGLEARRPNIMVQADGSVWRDREPKHTRQCIIDFVRKVQTDGLLIYQPGLVLQHRCTRVPGISLAICVREQDLVDPDFAAPLQLLTCSGRPVYKQPVGPPWPWGDQEGYEKNDQGLFQLPDLDLEAAGVLEAFQSGKPVVTLFVVDDRAAGHDHPYGVIYLRQAPRPARMQVLPLWHALAAAAEASAAVDGPGPRGAVGSSSISVSSGLQVRVELCKVPRTKDATVREGRLEPPPGALAAFTASQTSVAEGTPAPTSAPRRGTAAASAAPGQGPYVPIPLAGWTFKASTGQGQVQDKGARIVALDFSIDRLVSVSRPLEVQGRKPFRVHFLLEDQFGIPIEASPHVQQQLMAHGPVCLSLQPSGPNRRHAGSMRAEVVEGSWRWNEGASGGGGGAGAEGPAPTSSSAGTSAGGSAASGPPPTVHSVEVVVAEGRGQADLSFTVEGVTAAEGAPVSSTLSWKLPVLVVGGRELGPQGLVPELAVREEAAQQAGGPQPTCRLIHVSAQAQDDEEHGPPSQPPAAGAAGAGNPQGQRSSKRQRTAKAGAAAAQGTPVAAAGAAQAQQAPSSLLLGPDDPHAGLVPQGAEELRLEMSDGAQAQLQLPMHDALGCRVSAEQCVQVSLLPGFLLRLQAPGLQWPAEGQGEGEGAGGATRSGLLRVAAGKACELKLQVPRGTHRDGLPPQRLLLTAVQPGSTARPVLLEVVTSEGEYVQGLVAHLPRELGWNLLANSQLLPAAAATQGKRRAAGAAGPSHADVPNISTGSPDDGGAEAQEAQGMGPAGAPGGGSAPEQQQGQSQEQGVSQPGAAWQHLGAHDAFEEVVQATPSAGAAAAAASGQAEEGALELELGAPGAALPVLPAFQLLAVNPGGRAVALSPEQARPGVQLTWEQEGAEGVRLPASEEEAAPLPILQWAPSTSQAHVDAGGQAPSVASTAGHTIRVPSKAGDWWLCAHVPGVEALRIGPIAVLPGPPQALRMSRGRVAGLKGGPRELKRPQPHVLEPGQQGVACLTGESLSQAAVQPFEVELLDGWGNAHDLRGWAVRVLLRQLRRQEEEEARAAAGQAGSSGQGAVGGWTCDQEWTVHLLKLEGSNKKPKYYHPLPAQNIAALPQVINLSTQGNQGKPAPELLDGLMYELLVQLQPEDAEAQAMAAAGAPASVAAGGRPGLEVPLSVVKLLVTEGEEAQLVGKEEEYKASIRALDEEVQAAKEQARRKRAELNKADDKLTRACREVATLLAAGLQGPASESLQQLEQLLEDCNWRLEMGSAAHGPGLADDEDEGDMEVEGQEEAQQQRREQRMQARLAQRATMVQPVNFENRLPWLRHAPQMVGTLSASGAKVYGPVAWLMAAERKDVACALARYMSSRLEVFVVHAAGMRNGPAGDEDPAKAELKRRGITSRKLLSLVRNADTATRFTRCPVHPDHPQQPLDMSRHENDRVRHVHGLVHSLTAKGQLRAVGWAVNLIHLPPGLARLNLHIESTDRGGSRHAANLTLRQTLVTYLLGSLLVLERGEDIAALRSAMGGQPMHPVSLISLDGAQYGVGGAGMVQEDDRAQGYTEGALRLSGVPRALQLAAPLDMRVASVQARYRAKQAQQERITTAQAQQEEARQEKDQAQKELDNAEAEAEAVEARVVPQKRDKEAALSAVRAQLARIRSVGGAGPGAGGSGRTGAAAAGAGSAGRSGAGLSPDGARKQRRRLQ